MEISALKCPGCDSYNPDDANYCNGCGGKLFDGGVEYPNRMVSAPSLSEVLNNHESSTMRWIRRDVEWRWLISLPLVSIITLFSGIWLIILGTSPGNSGAFVGAALLLAFSAWGLYFSSRVSRVWPRRKARP